MMKKFLYILFLPFILIACGEDEPVNDLFEIWISEAPQGIEQTINDTECGISTNGEAQTITITFLGDYDSFRVTSSTIPDWIYATSSNSVLKLKLNEYNGGEYEMRSAEITFVVKKGSQSVNGRIIVHQYALTYEDMLNREHKAIQSYLSNHVVIDELPSISDIQFGNDAPFYKIDQNGYVYMQVVSKGNGPSATNGERIYFRFTRYDLLYYYKNGIFSEGWGNASDSSVGTTFFNLEADNEASKQWGNGIQLPMLLGLPIDSEVNLIIASKAGITSEVANVVPFLYNVRYFNSLN